MRNYSNIPDQVQGYPLNLNNGFFSIVIPEETINMCANPSAEFTLTNWTGVNANISQTYDWQAFGWMGIQTVPTSSSPGIYYGTVTTVTGGVYTASIYLQGTAGQKYRIYFASTAGATLGTPAEFYATGKIQRIWVTYTETVGASRRIYIDRYPTAYADLRAFYLDGLQVENKAYPTTYCDGDMLGFVRGRTDYWWEGAPHASASHRSLLTRSGGREVRLSDYGFTLSAIIGLGLAPITPRALQVSGSGADFQGLGTSSFQFSLVGSIFSDSQFHQQRLRTALIEALSTPALNQEMLLRYRLESDDGDPLSDVVDIRCTFTDFNPADIQENHQLKCVLTFSMFMPYITSAFTLGDHLALNTTLTHTNGIVGMRSDGSWFELDTGVTNAAGTDSGEIYDALVGQDGRIYVGGAFGSPDENFAIWNPITENWESTTYKCNGTIYTLTLAPNGDIYIGGSFTLIGGVAVNNVARLNASDGTISALGVGVNNTVFDSCLSADGYIIFVGALTTAGGGAANYFAKWHLATSAWSSTTGLDNIAYACSPGPNDNIYVGGSFTETMLVYDIRSKTNVFSALPTDILSIRPNITSVRQLSFAENAMLYIAARESSGAAGDVLLRYDGFGFTEVVVDQASSFRIWGIGTLMGDGSIFVSRGSTASGGSTTNNDTIRNDVFTPISIKFNTALYQLRGMIEAPSGYRYAFGFFDSLDIGAVAPDTTTTVINTGSAPSYPTMYLAGPMTLYSIYNASTGDLMLFDEMPIQENELVTISLQKGMFNIKSSTGREGMMSYILPGTNIDWKLTTGNNEVVVLADDTDTPSYLDIVFKPSYQSIDGAVFK